MNVSEVDTWVMIGGAVSTIAGSVVAWLMADTRSKTRWAYTEEKVAAIRQAQDHTVAVQQERISALEIKNARSDQDREGLGKSIERLEATKASKEVVDAFRSEVSSLRQDMDKRFDRIERILETKTSTSP